MKVTTEELERCEILMTIEVDQAQEQKMLKKAAKKIARQVQIPGFRPGKAPYNTVVRRFGIEAVQQEALEDAGDKILQDALIEAEIRPYAQIEFDNISWEPLTLKIKVPGQPKVELGDYREIRLDSEPVEVTQEDIDEELEKLQEQNAVWAPVERAAELNDLLSMAVVEKHEDEILAEHESIEYELILPAADDAAADDDDDETEESEAISPPFRPDLTTPLLGLSAGDEKTFSINYPDDFEDEKYAGKEIAFTINVDNVKVKELDPLDDDFAQSVSDFDTLAELKEDIKQKLTDHRQLAADQELGQAALDKIVEDATRIDWPVALEQEMMADELQRFNGQFQQAGLNLEDYLQIQNKSEEDLKDELHEDVITNLKKSVVLAELAKVEQLSVSNSEVLERAKSIADAFGGGDEIWQYLLSSDAQQSRIANEMMTTKVMLRLAAIAKGEAPELGEDVAVGASETELEAEINEEVTVNEVAEVAPAAEVDAVESGDEVETEVAEEESVANEA